MHELFEQRNFTHGGRRHTFILTLQTNLLHRHKLARTFVLAFVDDAIGPCAVTILLLCPQSTSCTFADFLQLLVVIERRLTRARLLRGRIRRFRHR